MNEATSYAPPLLFACGHLHVGEGLVASICCLHLGFAFMAGGDKVCGNNAASCM